MAKDWNKEGYFSGITEDYSNYRWYKGENENPYTGDADKPLAASLWEYEQGFHFAYLDSKETKTLSEAYQAWKTSFIEEHLPGKSFGGELIDWAKVFETGKGEE